MEYEQETSFILVAESAGPAGETLPGVLIIEKGEDICYECSLFM